MLLWHLLAYNTVNLLIFVWFVTLFFEKNFSHTKIINVFSYIVF